MQNDLAELQRWWPAYVKNDGIGGLSIDPILFGTQFGPDTNSDSGGLNDEANTAGVRVEAISDDGTPSGGSPTIVISGAGTLAAKATITHQDATTTIIRFIAPSAEMTNGFLPAELQRTRVSTGRVTGADETTGPFPVMMTIQEFAEYIDTYRNVGKLDSEKMAWLPHGIVGSGINPLTGGASTALPPLNADPREPTSVDFPTTSPYRATVFMPMLLDINQLDKRIANADNGISDILDPTANTGGYKTGVVDGITRYDAQPDGVDAATIRYKTAGYSGDHLPASIGGWQANNISLTHTHANPDISPDSSAANGPKYRMKMALAMFLKNGTYSLADGGVLIPYTYDPERTIGGKDTSTMYSTWDGLNGKGEDYSRVASYQERACSAQIWPLYDFVQGPIAPAAQSSNFDYSVVSGEHEHWPSLQAGFVAAAATAGSNAILNSNPRFRLLRNNPIPIMVEYISRVGNVLSIWCNHAHFYSGTPTNAYQPKQPFFLYGLTGSLGSDAASASSHWPAANTGASFSANRDHNGWWITNAYVADTFNRADINPADTGAFAGFKIEVRINANDAAGGAGNVAAYQVANGAFICQGLQGGYEDDDTPYQIETLRGADPLTDKQGTGNGFNGGISTPATTSFAASGHDAQKPGRITLGPQDNPDSSTGVYSSGVKYAPRSLQIVGAGDTRFALSPTIDASGGGVLRIPPALGLEYARRYYSVSDGDMTGTYAEKDDVKSLFADGFSVSSRWFSKGVYTPLWSYMENTQGRHAWDNIKPDGWTYGRNRPWPTHERTGTRLAYSPSLATGATSLASGWTDAAVQGDRVLAGQETTKYGLTENACSPIWLDMEMRAFIPARSNRMVRIEFDTGASHPVFGRHGMLFDSIEPNAGRGYIPLYDESGVVQDRTADSSSAIIPTTTYTIGRAVVWFWGNANYFASGWDATREWPFGQITTNGGFGSLANGYGTGGGFGFAEGMNTIRTVFTDAGMNLLVNGVDKGTDANSNNPVWGMTIECGDAGGASDGTTVDASGVGLRGDGPNYSKSQADLQIDTLVMRQVPSPSMLPFTVDTLTQSLGSVAQFTSLVVEADNVSTTKGMNITATIMTPSGVSPEAEGASAVAGFENIDLSFAGGIGSMDLSGLPASVVTSGFVIRWNFYIPSSADTTNHPINWNAIPIIRSWTLEYDIKPTATLSVIGNTYNGDISAPINTKVGHIVSFRASGTTTDEDRLISQFKFDFGDGTSTSWIDAADQTLQTTSYDSAHSYLSSGTFSAVCYTKDDRGNQSVASPAISIVVANAPPVAVLRAVPSLVRAGQPITLDGSASYDINAGGTLSAYMFGFGDGSSDVGGAMPSVQHTYAAGGEYRATLYVTDSDSAISQTASAIIKVLPATLVVPLVLNTKPRSFSRTRSASMTQTAVLDAVYPEITDMGQRSDEFVLEGLFLKATANADIAFMEELLLSGALVEFIWESVNFQGTPTGKTFVGRMTSFDYQREGGKHGETPYSANFVREAGLGA